MANLRDTQVSDTGAAAREPQLRDLASVLHAVQERKRVVVSMVWQVGYNC